jgi:hypothetical protein
VKHKNNRRTTVETSVSATAPVAWLTFGMTAPPWMS